MNEIHKFAEFINNKLKISNHWNPNIIVEVNHNDGTKYKFFGAFAKLAECDDLQWLLIFSSDEYYLFPINDLTDYIQYKTELIDIDSLGKINSNEKIRNLVEDSQS